MAVKAGGLIIGVVLLIIGIVVHAHYAPINALCSSALGTAAQGYSQLGGSISNMPNCSEASTGMDASWLLIAVGVVAMVGGVLGFIQAAATTTKKKAPS